MAKDTPIDPVEERDVLKLLAMLKEPRIRKALLETVEEEYEKKLNEPTPEENESDAD